LTLVPHHKSLWYVPCYNVAVVNNVMLMEQVNPNSGPYQGGTTITITGTDLGLVVQDIINVTIGGVPCMVNSNNYQPGIR